MKLVFLSVFVSSIFLIHSQNTVKPKVHWSDLGFYKKTGISVKFSGNSATVKWTNSLGGVTTETTKCSEWKFSGRGASDATTCTCKDGSYFKILMAWDLSMLYIDYYDELDSLIWKQQYLMKQ